MSASKSTELEPTDDQRIQRHVLKHIGKKNAREMAAELGVSPEEILRAKREIVESVDELSLQIRKLKLIQKAEEIAEDAQDAAERVSDERNKAGLYNSSISAMKTVLTELARTSKNESEAIKQLNEMRVRELLRLLDLTVSRFITDISEEHDIPERDLHEKFQSYLGPAAEELDAR